MGTTPARLVRPTGGLMAGAPWAVSGVAIRAVGIVGLPAAARPAADRFEGTKVCPLGEIGFAENDCTARTQFGGDSGILLGGFAYKCERAGAGLHLFAGVDVVLEQHRDAMQRPE